MLEKMAYEVDISLLFELTFYQRTHFSVLFPSIESRASRKPQSQVGTTGLAQRSFSGFVI
jgi:hypothetical protein